MRRTSRVARRLITHRCVPPGLVQTTNAPDYVNANDGEVRVRQDVFDPGNIVNLNWSLKVDLYEVVVGK